ncbi:hypothetical protein BKA56DRAFT_588017 [Ilyonectria sp. MPI-CAGE-AT-0026]|nr:hypothetical protein BKA56DRAFT_588017 [Ilyonectria sp. MPI-CAGE-AT-0026]
MLIVYLAARGWYSNSGRQKYTELSAKIYDAAGRLAMDRVVRTRMSEDSTEQVGQIDPKLGYWGIYPGLTRL